MPNFINSKVQGFKCFPPYSAIFWQWIMPVGKPAAFGTKYTGAEFLNYDAISSELIVQLKIRDLMK